MPPTLLHLSLSGNTCSRARTPRRAFLRDCARGMILGGLAVLGAVLAFRKGDPGFTEQCLKQRVCRGCSLFDGCALPQAKATRSQPS